MIKSERKIPVKNYIFLGIILIFSIFLVYYFYLWYQTYEKNKLNEPVMDNYLHVINYNELESYLLENENTLVYVSVVGDENIRNFEKKFKNVIAKYSFNDILYLDITDELSNDVKLDYNLNNNVIPCILVFQGDKLLDTYDIDINKYNMSSIKKYLVAMENNDD